MLHLNMQETILSCKSFKYLKKKN
uniref:Uncharacterized protein n=1 Tax=Rhizophora mucronata TaxID=61149 RepID=A0A2P2NYD9_RHIMU